MTEALRGVHLGAFELDRPIGKGGMGVVWRGRHVGAHVDVAIKLLTAGAARDPMYRESLRSEIRAVARMDHPAVVQIHDAGETDAAVERASGGAMRAGCPYLVMELADGGSLAEWRRRLPWKDLREVLLVVLEALAHAHARGVLHRDLKTGNVLLARGQRPGWRLTDFGLAQPFAARDPRSASARLDSHELAGTPDFMAPEQVRGDARRYGPWTDLYALGCLAWSLATGRPPFQRASDDDTLAAHLALPPPPFEPAHATPPRFESWLRRLLEKVPTRRFARCADAAHALRAIPDDGGEADCIPATSVSMPAMPETWRTAQTPAPRAWLPSTGALVYAVREPPLVGRDRERDALWAALARVHAKGRPSCIVLRGASGYGKSRLAEWLCERAHETGAATPMVALHGRSGGPLDGLGPMLARHLQCAGLGWEDAKARIEESLLDETLTAPLREAEALARFTTADPAEETAGRATEGPNARHLLVLRALRRAARDRPVVVVLDDAQWGQDAIEFVDWVMRDRRRSDLACLFVLTLRDDALAERPGERTSLDALMERDSVDIVPLDSLAAADHRSLVASLAGLGPDLARAVAARTDGSPLFAVELVHDWVRRGILVAGRHGFDLAPGSGMNLPDDLHAVWAARTDRFLEGRSADDETLLELAATLGHEVAGGEWAEAARTIGRDLGPGLLDALIDERMARTIGSGPDWCFVHGMLRESLERRAHERGQGQPLHLACARMLGCRGRFRNAERIARHLERAGRPEEAVDAYLRAAREALRGNEWSKTRALLAERERVLVAAGIPESDERWGEGRQRLAVVELRGGDPATGAAMLAEIETAARRHGWHCTLGRVRVRCAELAEEAGDIEGARQLLEEAYTSLSAHGDSDVLSGCAIALHRIYLSKGDAHAAETAVRRAIAHARASGDDYRLCNAWWSLGNVCSAVGRQEDARSHYEDAYALAVRAGYRERECVVHFGLGDVARYSGDFDSAGDHYRAALSLAEALGSREVLTALLNLALVGIERRRSQEARSWLDRAEPLTSATGSAVFRAAFEVAHAGCAALDGDASEFERAVASADAILCSAGANDEDVVRALRIAGDLAAEAGWPDRSASTWRMALARYQALGLEDEVARLATRLAGR